MRRGARNLSWTVLGLGLLLLVGVGLGWIPIPEFLQRDAKDVSQGARVLEETDHEAEDPSLRGRTVDEAPEPGPDVVPAPVDLDAVDRSRDLHGIVVREDGSPVAGAVLQVLVHPWRHQDLLMDHGFWDVDEGPRTLSAVDGTFRLGLEPGALVALRVSAEGLAPVEMHLLQAGERVRVVLREPARIRVVVRGPDGEPVEGTALRLFHRGGRGRSARGITDAAGVYLFATLEPGRRGWIDVVPPRFGYPGWVQFETPAAGEETTVDVDLPEGRTLRGRVTDAATGEGVAGARVGMNWVLQPEVKTDENGAYELGGWTGMGIDDIHVLAEGYARETRVVDTPTEIDFALTRVPAAIGRVLDGDGKPVDGARVYAIGVEREANESRLSLDDTRTGADGRYRLTGLTPGRSHMLIVVAPGFGRTWRPFTADAGEKGVIDLGDLTLPPGLVLAGVVVSAEDVPRARAELELLLGAEEYPRTRGITLDRTTDDLGRFRFPDLSSGTYQLRVRPLGGVEQRQVIRLENEDLTDLRVVITADVEVVVLVKDESGAPVAEADVSFVGTGRRHARTRTDADGRAVARLPADGLGEYIVSAHCSEPSDLMPSARRSLRADEREVELVLRRAVTTRGRLQTVEGTPVPAVPFSVRRGEQVVAWARTAADGTFSFRTEPGPPVDLVFDGRLMRDEDTPWHDFEGRLDGVRVGATDVIVIVRASAADRTLEIRVLDPEGNPVTGAMVIARSASGVGVPVPRTDATGTSRVEGLRSEEIGLKVLHGWTEEAPWAAPPEIRVVPDGQRVALTMRRARLLTGLVTCRVAPVPAWTRVRVEHADGAPVSEGGGGRDGKIRVAVPLDEEGPLFLVAEGRIVGGSTVTGRMAVPPPEAGEIELELRAP